MNKVKYYNSDGKVEIVKIAKSMAEIFKSKGRWLPTLREADEQMHLRGFSRRGGKYASVRRA